MGVPAALPACRGIAALSPLLIPSSGASADSPAPPEAAAKGLHAVSLRCEYLVDPLGIDTPAPRMSWQLSAAPESVPSRGRSQSAYRILAAAAVDELAAGRGTAWDSGRVAAGGSANVAYAGRPLAGGERCFWAVRVWDEAGRAGPWSAPAWFEMGLLGAADWKATWIRAPDPAVSSPLLRKEFALPGPVTRARAYVAGLGFSELYLNGAKVGDRVLDPVPTFYHNDQEPELQDRVLYSAYDVTGLLREGRNAVGVWLGNGWYSSDRPAALRPDPLAEPLRGSAARHRATGDRDRRGRPAHRDERHHLGRRAGGRERAAGDPRGRPRGVARRRLAPGRGRHRRGERGLRLRDLRHRLRKPHEISESERTIDTMSNL